MEKGEKVSQDQIHQILFEDRLSWQAIIYDLINTEQLDPWDIDLSLLANKYLDRVRELEDEDFFISSKVLLAASLLLRLKSEYLLAREISSLDDILFGKKEDKKYIQERIELDEELPALVPRTPLPRHRKVTLSELMTALGKAIKTERRRINKDIAIKQHEREADVVLPKSSFNLQDKIKEVYSRLNSIFKNRDERLAFSELVETGGVERFNSFISLLHLDHQRKVWLEQEGHLEEIWIWLQSLYEEKNKEKLKAIRDEIDKLESDDGEIYEEGEYDEDIKVDTGFSQEIEGEIEDVEKL